MATTPIKQLKAELASWQARLEQLEQGIYCGQRDVTIANKIRWFISTFWKLPASERAEISGAWKEYYHQCHQSPEAELYREMCIACKNRDNTRRLELQAQARAMLKLGFERIAAPKGVDPEEWNHNPPLVMYREARTKISDLTARIAEQDSYRPASMVAVGGVF
jgi:hypothetical protein